MSVHGTKPYSYIIHCLRWKRCTRLRWGPSQHTSCLAIRNNPNAHQQENIKNNGIYMTEFYREMTRNEILPHATTWINITNMRVMERHHKKTQTVWVNLSAHFSCSVMSDSVTPWTAACQAPLFITNSRSLLKLLSIESVMPSNHLILCRPLLLPPPVFPSIRVFSNESVLLIRWPKYWSL